MNQPLPIASFAKVATGCASLALLIHFLSPEAWAQFARDIFGHVAFGHGLAALLMRFTRLGAPAPQFVDAGSPPLPVLAKYLAAATMLQISLGALYRYGLSGFAPHLAGALVASAFLLYAATGVFAPAPPGHRARIAAFVLLWVTVAQIGFGIGAYFVRVNQDAHVAVSPALKGLTHSHILTGALTFSLVLLLSVLLRRDVVLEARAR
jgi:hypothetical protein